MSNNQNPITSEDCNKATNDICKTDKTVKTTNSQISAQQTTSSRLEQYAEYEKWLNKITMDYQE